MKLTSIISNLDKHHTKNLDRGICLYGNKSLVVYCPPMDILVVYDSNFGNTKKVATCIASNMGSGISAISVNDFKQSDLLGIRLLIVGSPINAWRPTKKIKEFLANLNPVKMKGVKAAAFDTRVKSFISGNAAKKIAKSLQDSGANLIDVPIGFYVKGNEGPLVEGELVRAGEWAQLLSSKL